MFRSPLIENLSPGAKFLMLILLIIIGLFTAISVGLAAAVPFLGGGVTEMMTRTSENMLGNIGFLKYFQIVSQIGFFILPVLIYCYLIEGKAAVWLRLNLRPDWITLIFAISLIVISVPLINLLLEWNQTLRLPDSLAGLENWMKSTEAGSDELTKAFLDTSTMGGFLVNILMIAVLPAIGEEFLFRGAITRIFFEWSGNKHLAVIFAAFLFSAMHLQFYGFLPRFALGLMLGYLFVLSGNLWLSIGAHFVNNLFVVVAAFLFHRGIISTDINEYQGTEDILVLILSFVSTAVLMLVFYFRLKKTEIVLPG